MRFVASHITVFCTGLAFLIAGISCDQPRQQPDSGSHAMSGSHSSSQSHSRSERHDASEQDPDFTSQTAPKKRATEAPESMSLQSRFHDSLPFGQKRMRESPRLPVLERAIHINSMDTAGRQHIRKRLYTAHQQLQEGFYQKALSSYDSIGAMITYNPGYRPYLAQLYSGIANVHWAIGNYDTALAYFSKGLSIIDSHPDDSLSSVVVNTNFGLFLSTLGYYEKALHYLRKAAHVVQRQKESKRLGRIYLNIGITYGRTEEKDNLPKAEYYIRKALTLAQRYGDTITERAGLSNLGLVHDRKDDPDSALYYYQEALKLATNRPSGELASLMNLASLYFAQSDFEQSAFYLEQGLQLGGSLKERDNLYYWLGLTYHNLGKYEASSRYLHKAILTTDSINGQKIDVEVQRIQNRYELEKTEKERLENRLLIARQEVIIQRKTGLTYAIIGAVIICSVFVWILLRSRQRIQRQQELRRVETAAWEASIEGEERERRRLAHHLHDHVAGNLSTVRAWLETLRRSPGYNRQETYGLKDNNAGISTQSFSATGGGQEESKQEKRSPGDNYQDALQLLDETLTEVRNTAHHLMPALLLRMGLVEAVRVFCSNVQRATGLFIRYHYFGFIDIRNKNKELILYRCIQELVQNIVKHAKASQALVQLSRHDTLLIINVEDNGVGHPATGEERKTGEDGEKSNGPQNSSEGIGSEKRYGPEDNGEESGRGRSAAGSRAGIGLSGIKENIAKIQGRFQWLSEPGKGVSVEIEIPIFDAPE